MQNETRFNKKFFGLERNSHSAEKSAKPPLPDKEPYVSEF